MIFVYFVRQGRLSRRVLGQTSYKTTTIITIIIGVMARSTGLKDQLIAIVIIGLKNKAIRPAKPPKEWPG